jgi:lipoate-protein ligase A
MWIFDKSTDPVFNLAAEEWLLSRHAGPVLRIWRNAPCVVLGRHQIPCREVNLPLAVQRHVPVLRRASGGGTVYHDEGNLNFTILTGPDGDVSIDFERMCAPVIAALGELGLPAVHAGRGELRLGEKKISGGAAHLQRGKLLYHGTLLYAADCATLEELLAVQADGVQAKSIRSVRRTVVNISEVFPKLFTGFDAFADHFAEALACQLGLAGECPRALTDAERGEITSLTSKYRSLEWNCGASPAYVVKTRGGFEITVKTGRIAEISGESLVLWPDGLAGALTGCFHEIQSLTEVLANFDQFPGCPVPLDFFP